MEWRSMVILSATLLCFISCKKEAGPELLDYSGPVIVYNKSLGGVIDTIDLVQGKGTYQSTYTEGKVANLTFNPVDKHFAHYMVLEEGTIEIFITKDSVILFGGTPNNELLGELAKKTEPLRLGIHKLQHADYSHLDSLSLIDQKEKDLTEIRSLASQWSDYERAFALDNDNLAGLVFLRKKKGKMSLEELEKVLDQYKSHSDHDVYISTQKYYEAAKKTAIGRTAPPVKLEDDKGQVRDLQDVKSKVILLDFWASWCVPCRKEIPHLKEMYHTYHKQGFDIVSISIDDDMAAWQKAMLEEKMPWTQLIDKDDIVAKEYYIRSVPRLFLLDQDKKILAKDVRGEKLTETLAELFGDQ